ncbi:MnmE: tRNA modification GTPase [Desulfosarcina variabilis str. Montpellier]|uniref:tRNA uridine-5-carboxymethylaminomethyl(34) synthesis GTPase MnmE n=1 Tax=Desulfosarcina variabilis TaxID=2300 RepID=UPI003AFADB5F
MDNRTIAAISTPLGPGGIGIIRISGPEAFVILKKLFVFKRKKSAQKNDSDRSFSSHRVYYGYLHEAHSDTVIDEVLVFFMKAPNSYTREDVVEIQSHSGYIVLERIMGAILDAGADLAKPGEFTQRAFLNGRIDLTQAEAVIDLINAPCEIAAKNAVKQASGGIKDKIETLLHLVNELYGKCEAVIEFAESDNLSIEETLLEIRQGIFDTLLVQVRHLIQAQKSSAIFYDGVLMTIAGVPNVGKSSLLNQLVEKETAIVSEMPGTTRDVIREYLSIKGIPITLCDTAGLHETQDPVECIGIDKARDHIDRAELLLFVVEANRELNDFENQFITDNAAKRIIVVVNKVDIAVPAALEKINKHIDGFISAAVSAKTGLGIADLKELIFNGLVKDQMQQQLPTATPNLRQRKILECIEQMIFSDIENARTQSEPELMADLLGRIRKELEKITGSTNGEDLYDFIFSQFCVGK